MTYYSLYITLRSKLFLQQKKKRKREDYSYRMELAGLIFVIK